MRILRVVLALVLIFVTSSAMAASSVWVCPMADHTQEFDKPGRCPICGMELVDKEKRFSVAVLVFNYAEDIDFTAPIEVFGHTGAQIFTVAATTDPITTVFGLHIRPDYDIAHAPASTLLIIPGGGVKTAIDNPAVIAWVRERANQSRYVMSVCNGAFIAQKAGLLDGLTATTTAGRIEELASIAPKTHVVRKRVVDNGKVITTGGLSAGIDGALHVIDREWGRTRAEEIARGIEYRWDPDSKWSRAALADTRLPDLNLPNVSKWEKVVDSGDTTHWDVRGRLTIGLSQDQLLAAFTKQIVDKGWRLQKSTDTTRTFVKKDRDGLTWQTTFGSVPDHAPSTYIETMSIKRVM
jgi:putative intracellular protease/amidase